jgi:formylglycine-generating enzyme required for sulfatase activity
VSVTTLLLLSVLSAPSCSQDLAPPGMVLIAGGRYDIGADAKYIKALIEKTDQRPLAAECPPESMNIEDFYIMPTEVTNEQFAKFIDATGTEPPELWGEAVIGAAGLAYATETGKAKKDAREAGLPLPKFDAFDSKKWWKDNWKDAEWGTPKGLESHPVVYISYERAEAYARWAGLRLISEAEFQIAARGDTGWRYPWGDDWKSGFANTIEANIGKTTPVGTYPNGAAWHDSRGRFIDKDKERGEEGSAPVFDLVGNVWEWTRSPFIAFQDFKALEVKLSSGKEKLIPDWDASKQIGSSGSFQMPSIAARVTVRRGTDRGQSTQGLGMRCTASVIPGLDVAENILRNDLPTSRRPVDTVYNAKQVTAIDKWTFEAGTSKAPGYSVISGYSCIAFIPVEKAEVPSVILMKERSKDAPIEIGAFSTTVPLLEPALDPGTYTLSWRAGGEVRKQEAEQDEEGKAIEAPAEEEPQFPFDVMEDTVIFRNTSGEIVGSTRCSAPEDKTMVQGHVAVSTITPEDAIKFGSKAGESLVFQVFVPKRASKGFRFEIPVLVAPGAVNGDWRK